MGNSICRVFLAPTVTAASTELFAEKMRRVAARPVSLFLRDLTGRRVRMDYLKAARDAQLRFFDIEPVHPATQLATLAESAFGSGHFVVRVADDEELNDTLPSVGALVEMYPGIDISSFLDPDEVPIPWNSQPFFICPGNPLHWSLKVPLMAPLLSVATPGESRPCPACRNSYISNGYRGQCPSCGFIAWPFSLPCDAVATVMIPLDAFGWGSCSRCGSSREFTYEVQQCFRCGQLMEGNPGRHKVPLVANKAEIIALVATLDLS